ncbi:hypothetical protein [Paenibacillus sp. FSL R10-2778]|uniref:hypothetical protein n=1 Tax=Paenibacillus sp. FSL R10-2778 TaxID=2954659 RepID=UPI0031592A38
MTQRDWQKDIAMCEAATEGPWTDSEDDSMWMLFGGHMGAMQLIKAPKRSTPFAEYWPDKVDVNFIKGARTALPYWLKEAKERGERERKLKKTLERIAEATEDIFTKDAARHILSILYPDTPAPTTEIKQQFAARPLDEWHEEMGDMLWWMFPIQEPPYCGNPLDSDWSDCYTHWTPFVIPAAPAPKEGAADDEPI